MTVKPAQPGNGFDCNTPLTPASAKVFRDQGMEFAIRYLPRTPALIPGCLTKAERDIILAAGLALSAVQHCPLPGFTPSGALGLEYGQYAGKYGGEIELGMFMNIWLDLEGVASGTPAQDVIDYCTQWFDQVQAADFVPGLYVGYGSGLTPKQIYDLPFQHYWKAYNYDDGVPERGFQLIQHPAKVLSGISYDPNTCAADLKGDMPIFLFP
jgi:hypothetical protein